MAPTQRERLAAMETARKEMESIVDKQRIDLAKKSRTKSMNAFNILPGSGVLVRRKKGTNGWGLANYTSMIITRLPTMT